MPSLSAPPLRVALHCEHISFRSAYHFRSCFHFVVLLACFPSLRSCSGIVLDFRFPVCIQGLFKIILPPCPVDHGSDRKLRFWGSFVRLVSDRFNVMNIHTSCSRKGENVFSLSRLIGSCCGGRNQ